MVLFALRALGAGLVSGSRGAFCCASEAVLRQAAVLLEDALLLLPGNLVQGIMASLLHRHLGTGLATGLARLLHLASSGTSYDRELLEPECGAAGLTQVQISELAAKSYMFSGQTNLVLHSCLQTESCIV